MSYLDYLPTLNAILNTFSGLLLIIGYLLIRRGRRSAHKKAMLGAASFSTVFLVSYVIYHIQTGSKAFTGTGTVRTVYFAILITHVILAVVIVPLVARTLWFGLGGKFDRHRPLARRTLPLWLYVSVTGVIIYLMLYQMSFS